MFNTFGRSSLFAVLLAALPACGDDTGEVAPIRPNPLEVAADARSTYASIVLASYEDSLTGAQDLDDAIQAFVAAPSADALDDAREAWLASREPYLQTEVYRFYDGPIDKPDGGPEGQLNAWPLDENYIDYTEDEPEAGIINDLADPITGEELESLNEGGGEKNISTGYHAVEFLLWGQDLSDTGPGDRPFTDYVTGSAGTHENQDRRAEYLTTASSLMIGHLEDLATAWDPATTDSYRDEFLSVDVKESLRRMLTGMRILSGNETGGERLEAALLTGDQEDEHSCFSDNTHRDMIQDVQGVWNVWHGRYVRLDGSVVQGTGIDQAVHALDPDLADSITAQIDESMTLAEALHPPFADEIALSNPAGRARVQALVDSLQAQAELLDDAFRGFELEIPAPPE